jgi:hypothetical protein
MKFLSILGIIIVSITIVIFTIIMLLPWMDHWGTKDEELVIKLPGDNLLAEPLRITNRAVTINAPNPAIYPWLVQMGADKSGLYSYTWLENLVGCKMANVEEIREEWQQLQPGDIMKMCAKDPAPPPYEVAQVIRDEAVVYYHLENGRVVDTWAFVILPQSDGTNRLISRTRTTLTGGIWEFLRPISFMMERKMLLTIKNLAENL